MANWELGAGRGAETVVESQLVGVMGRWGWLLTAGPTDPEAAGQALRTLGCLLPLG